MQYLTTEKLEAMSPEELIREKKLLHKRLSEITQEAKEWKQCYQQVRLELAARISMLEVEVFLTEEDRLTGDPKDYDHLCRIH